MHSIVAKLIFLPAYQNYGMLVDYFDPWIALWTEDFIKSGLKNETKEKILSSFSEEQDLEDIIQTLPNIKNYYGFEYDLLLDWADWIWKDQNKKEIVKKELNNYFFWEDKPFWETESGEIDQEEIKLWRSEEGMPKTPQEAYKWYKGL